MLEAKSFKTSEQSGRLYRDQLVDEALVLLGKKGSRYKGPEYGMSPEDGFDCSGFVTYLLTKIGFPRADDIRHANEYFDKFGVLIHSGLQKSGDLVFFSRNGLYPSHVGIMTASGEYIHSPGKDNTFVTTEKLEHEPIPMIPGQIYNINPIGFKRLAVSAGRYNNIS